VSKPENYCSGIENKMPTYSGLKSAALVLIEWRRG